MKFEAILFDCDGVLVDSEPLTLGTLRDMLADLKPERLACCHRGHAWHLSQLFADFGREELTGRVLHEEVSGELPVDGRVD